MRTDYRLQYQIPYLYPAFCILYPGVDRYVDRALHSSHPVLLFLFLTSVSLDGLLVTLGEKLTLVARIYLSNRRGRSTS